MGQEPYPSARRVFWITDNASSHRGESSIQRLLNWYSNAIQIHTPVHASWLNQVEIIFSILQRKDLTPNDFTDLIALRMAIFGFEDLYNEIAKPFQGKYAKDDLKKTLEKIEAKSDEITALLKAA